MYVSLLHKFLPMCMILLINFLCFCVLFTHVIVSWFFSLWAAMRRKTFVKCHLTEIIWRMIKDGLHGTSSEIKIQYITIPGTVVLSCQYEKNPTLRWRRRNLIISQDSRINPDCNGSERFRATNKLCIVISLLVPWRPSLIIRKKYKMKCMYKQSTCVLD
jgi:hypothetical protein